MEYNSNIDGSGLLFPYGDIASGFISGGLSQYDFGTAATLTCNTGFSLTGGDSVRTCDNGKGVEGEWSGEQPDCQGEKQALF